MQLKYPQKVAHAIPFPSTLKHLRPISSLPIGYLMLLKYFLHSSTSDKNKTVTHGYTDRRADKRVIDVWFHLKYGTLMWELSS